MANWKKVIVSGSQAQLNQLSVDTDVNITGSLNASGSVYFQGLGNSNQANIVSIDIATGQLYYQGTGSFTADSASYAFSASYASNASTANSATSASYASNASTANSATSASYASNATSANTASYVNTLNQAVVISGSLAISTTTGNSFDINADTLVFTGSLSTTGSVSFAGLTQQSSSYLVGYDPTTGNLYYEGTGSVVSVTSSYAVSASYAVEAGKVTEALTEGTGISSFTYDGSNPTTVAVSGAADLTATYLPLWTGDAFANSTITDGTGVTINNAYGVLVQQGGLYVTGASTFHDAVVFQGDVTVQGTASFQNVTNLAVQDQFILLNSGSTTFQDSGIVINTGNDLNSGSAWFLETAATTTGTDALNGRFAVASGVLPDATSATAAEYANTTKIQAGDPITSGSVPQWGGTLLGQGNMWVDTNNGDIYIYA